MLFNLSSELGYSIIIYCGGDRTLGKKARSHFGKERAIALSKIKIISTISLIMTTNII